MLNKEKPLFYGQGQRSGNNISNTESIPDYAPQVKPQAQESIALRHYGCPRLDNPALDYHTKHIDELLPGIIQKAKDRAARTHP